MQGNKGWGYGVEGHEGHHVTLTAHVYADKNEVHVMSLKMAGDSTQK